jgi:hypothetical protein
MTTIMKRTMKMFTILKNKVTFPIIKIIGIMTMEGADARVTTIASTSRPTSRKFSSRLFFL